MPVITAEQTRTLLGACASRSFMDLRDQAIIRLFYNTGGPPRFGGRVSLVVVFVDDDRDRRCLRVCHGDPLVLSSPSVRPLTQATGRGQGPARDGTTCRRAGAGRGVEPRM
ncbi:hypothetical protein [Asanoa hainanensis]|uniref:hypothetical protein n=1 Tax=Asanoa hainanensis TaxID=560556 RepID=UPI001FE3E40C|nr:hypothetical protein [Asanoa hainanensis]